MNLARHISVLWRFRAIVLIGVLLGFILAFLAAFQVPSMERRGGETWSAVSDVRVTQQGFPEGRVTPCLPTPIIDGTKPDSEAPCADQSRFVQLALYYAQVAVSDEVRRRVPEQPPRGAVSARNVDATGNGQGWMPIIELTTAGATAEGAVQLNKHVIEALSKYLSSNQNDANTPEDDRVQLRVLNEPAATLVSGRSLTIPLLVFMLCILGAVAVAHILENLRTRADVDSLDALDFDPSPNGDAYADGRGYPASRYDVHGPEHTSRRPS